MKRQFFSTLLFFVLFLFVLNLQGDVSYKQEPMITSYPLTFTKYIDILSNKVSWSGGNSVAHVAVSAELEGLGYATATLKDVYLMGKPSIAIYGNPTRYYFGSRGHNGHGSWKSGTTWASATKYAEIPDKAKDGDSWDWGAGDLSEISPTQYQWNESTSWGVNISIPKGITGRYTTTGGWGEGSLPVMTAAAKSGTHKLVVKYICHQCYATGKTPEDIGGKVAHEKIPCSEPNCSVKYHKCSEPSGHGICEHCGKRECNGDDHSYLTTCNSEWVSYTQWVEGCGEKIYHCNYKDHCPKTYSCGHTLKACQYASHDCENDGDDGSNTSNTVSKSAVLSGSSSASAGSSVTVDVSTTTPYSSVWWYVAGPGESGLGTNVETDTGGSSSTSASLTYTFGSSDSGDYVITAYIYDYSDSSTYETSYTVSVSGSSISYTPPSDDTPNCSDCTSHCSSPCSCSNSGTCNGSVYTPPSTPPAPPAPSTVSCSRGCGASVSSRTEHRVSSCSNCGQSYWTCGEWAHKHTVVLTCKRSGCGASLTRCQNGSGKCKNGRAHWL